MTYRCQGCRQYHREVYRRIGLGSVCSDTCATTVMTRQRGGTGRDNSGHGLDRDQRELPSATVVATKKNLCHGDEDSAAKPATSARRGEESAARPERPPETAKPDDNDEQTPNPVRWSAPHNERDEGRDAGMQLATADDAECIERDGKSRDHRTSAAGRRQAHVPDHIRRRVLARDGCCRFCGRRVDLHVHHINYRSQGVDHRERNLIVLCPKHHDTVHSNKRRWQPVCKLYIVMVYEGRRAFLLEVERILASAANDT